MGDINFISNNSNNNSRRPVKNRETSNNVKWTEPNTDKAIRNNSNPLAQVLEKRRPGSQPVDKNTETATKQVSDNIGAKHKNVMSGFLNKFFRDSSSENFSEVDKIKNNKKVLVDYQKIFKKEKEQRGNKKSETIATPLDKEENADNKTTDKEKNKSFFNYKKSKIQGTIKTNLIKNEVTTFIDWGGNLKFSVLSLSLVFVIIFSIYGFLIYREKTINKESDQVKEQIEDLTQRISNLEKSIEDKEIGEFQKKLKIAKLLLDKHVYWTNFFYFLENKTIKDVYYNSGFSGKNDGKYVITAQTKNFSDILDQVSLLNNEKQVVEAKVTSGSLAEDKETGKGVINFDLELNVAQDMFYK